MRATLVVARAASISVLPEQGPVREYPLPGAGARAAEPARGPGRLPPALLADLTATEPPMPVVAVGQTLSDALAAALGRPVGRADGPTAHAALAALAPEEPTVARERLLAGARAALAAALRSPEEVLVSLAREEERVERSVGREARAAEAFIGVPGTSLEEYANDWGRVREGLVEHHRHLVRRLEAEAARTVPNLSAVVGPRTAARLVAAAGGVAPLARVSSSRLQLLGSRRRPGPERGPRFGVLYRASGMEEAPVDRRGAYARSLASLAVIAARADALTHRMVADALVRRRDARLAELRRRRR